MPHDSEVCFVKGSTAQESGRISSQKNNNNNNGELQSTRIV